MIKNRPAIGLFATMIALGSPLTGQTSAEAQECHQGAYSTICRTDSGTESTGDTWGTQVGLAINQWFRRQLSGEASHDRATQINNQGVQLYNSGNYAGAIALYRQALAINPDSVNIRLNLMFALTQESARLFQSSHDAATLARVESMISEVEGLDRVSLAGNPDRDRLLQWAASGRREVASVRAAQRQEAENQRALASASQNISSIARDLSTTISSDSRRRSPAQQGGLGFGDPSATPNLNPAAGTPQAQEITGSPRAPTTAQSVGSTDARRQLEAISQNPGGAAPRLGGTSQGFDTSAAPGTGTIGAFSPTTYTREQIAAYSQRSPVVREANERVEHERQAADRARARQTQLEAQRSAATTDQERQRIQIEIVNNTEELNRAAGAQRVAENERTAAIQVVVREGGAIIEGEGDAPPPAATAPTRERRQ